MQNYANFPFSFLSHRYTAMLQQNLTEFCSTEYPAMAGVDAARPDEHRFLCLVSEVFIF